MNSTEAGCGWGLEPHQAQDNACFQKEEDRMAKNRVVISGKELEPLEKGPRELRQFVKDSERAEEEATKRISGNMAKPETKRNIQPEKDTRNKA